MQLNPYAASLGMMNPYLNPFMMGHVNPYMHQTDTTFNTYDSGKTKAKWLIIWNLDDIFNEFF